MSTDQNILIIRKLISVDIIIPFLNKKTREIQLVKGSRNILIQLKK